MAEICLNYDENTTLDEIYEELVYYKKKNTNVCTYYKGHKLSNQNLEELKTLIERLKLNMNEAEYSVYAKKQKEEESVLRKLFKIRRSGYFEIILILIIFPKRFYRHVGMGIKTSEKCYMMRL